MKQANVVIGRPYMVSLGRRGSKRAVVVGQMPKSLGLGHEYVLHTSDGSEIVASHRRLSPVPVNDKDGNHIASEV